MVDGLYAANTSQVADFRTVVFRQKQLGFNAVRLPFDFSDLNLTPKDWTKPCKDDTSSLKVCSPPLILASPSLSLQGHLSKVIFRACRECLGPTCNEGLSIMLHSRIMITVVLLQSVHWHQLRSTCCLHRLACRTLTPPTAPLTMPQWSLLHSHQQAPCCATLTCPAALPWTATSMLLSTTSLR